MADSPKPPNVAELQKENEELRRRLQEAERRAGEALHSADPAYRAVLDAIPDLLFLLSKTGEVLDFRAPANGDLYVPPEIFLGKKVTEVLPPQVAALIAENLEQVIVHGFMRTFDYPLEYPDGVRYFEARMARSGADRVVAIVRDVTFRIQAVNELRREKERANNYLEIAQVMIVALDADGAVTMINRKGCEVLERNEDEVVGKNWFDHFLPASIRADVKRVHAGLMAGQIEVNAYIENLILTKSGEERLVAWHNTVIRDETGRITGTLSSALDVTEARRTEAELRALYEQLEAADTELRAQYNELMEREREVRESEERFRKLAEMETDVIVMVDQETGRLLDANPAACALYGYSLEELRTITARDMSAEPEVTSRSIKERIFHVPLRYHRKKDGTAFPVEIYHMAHSWRGHTVVTAAIRDLTMVRRMEEELRRADRLESVGLLAGGIAHDFNNILSGVVGNISLARFDLAAGRDVTEYLDEAERAAFRARDLTKQMLTFARGGAPIKKAASVRDVAVESAGFVLRGSPCQCVFEGGENIWLTDIDPGQMTQVFNNIFINAVQAMPRGGTIHVRAENVVLDESEPGLKPGRWVKIQVSDAGIGIAQPDLARIFDPYFTTKKTGSGLGLATVYSIIKGHDGRITVASRPGEATTFTILLPASSSAAPDLDAPGSAPVQGGGKILLIDDEELVRNVASMMLLRLGYAVETAAEGGRGITLYQSAKKDGRPFDAVITDLTIPGGMGGDFIAQLLKLDPHALVIVASGYSNDPVLANFSHYGFAGMVAKPFNLGDLSATLAGLIGKGETPPAP